MTYGSQIEREHRSQEGHDSEVGLAVIKKGLLHNDEEFECPICMIPIEVGEGVKLRECFHNICKYGT